MTTADEGPFMVGDRVLVYDTSGQFVIDKGTVLADIGPFDDEYSYDVRGDLSYYVGISELLLETADERRKQLTLTQLVERYQFSERWRLRVRP